MKALINKFYDIREGEWKLTLAFFAVSFLLMVAVYFLKPARDSLFLVGLGANSLPWVFILIAVVSIPITGLIIRAVQKYKSYRVFLWTNILIILQLLIIRQLFVLEQNWVYVLFYLWVGIFTILIVSQFWVFANEAYTTAQSKRIFPLLNLGAILGAIAGSNATSAIISLLETSTENLLYLSMAALVVISLITLIIGGSYQPKIINSNRRDKKTLSTLGGLTSIFRSKYQLIIAGIIGSAMLVSTLADYQLKAVAIDAFPDKAGLTSFMGIFYGSISLLALIIQIALSGRILRKIGLGGALLARPAGLFVGAILMAIEPVLAFAVFLGGIDNATQYSIDKTGREILFLPFTQKVKEQIKIFMDVIVDRFFKGFAGLMLLVLVALLEFNVRQIALVTVVFSFFWLLLSRLAHREYVQQFREALNSQYIDMEANAAFDLNEPKTIQIISNQLKSNDNIKVLRALQLLEGNPASPFAEDLQHLLYHQLYDIRLLALRLLSSIPDKNFTEDILSLLKEEDTEIRLESINYVCMYADDDPDKVLSEYLNSNASLDKSSALGCISKYGDKTKKAMIKDEMLESIIQEKDKANNLARAQTAQVLGYLKGDKALKYLPQLLNDPSPAVKKEAVKSMGEVRDPDFIPLLVETLKNKELITEAREALASYGEKHIKTIVAFLPLNHQADDQFRAIVKTLATMPYQETIAHLLDILHNETSLGKRYIIISALSTLRTKSKQSFFSKKVVLQILEDELKQSYLLLLVSSRIPDEAQFQLLHKVLREHRDQIKEHLFRLLGLIFDPNDLYGAFQGHHSANVENKSAALELLENLLEGNLRKLIITLIDPVSDKKTIATGQHFYDFAIDSYEKAMAVLLNTNDSWLRAAALFSITPQCPLSLQNKLRSALDDDNLVVRQTAELVMHKNNQKA